MHVHLRAVAASSILLLSSTPLFAQSRVWIVDANGGAGSHFTDLAQAIDQAGRGDVLRVRAGSYGAIQVRKALSIFGEPGASLSVPTFATEALLVEGIPAGDEVSILGFDIGRLAHIAGLPIKVRACQGSVLLGGLRASMTGNSAGGGGLQATVRIEDSRLVLVTESTFVGPPAIFVTGSTLVLTDSSCAAPSVSGNGLERTDAAILANNSTVLISRGTMQGGNVTVPSHPIPGAALEGTATRWIVTGGAALRAGAEQNVAVPAIAGDGVATVHPSVQLVPTGGAPAVDPRITVTTAFVPSLAVTGARIGGNVQLHLIAEPGQAATVVFGFLGGPIDIGFGVPLFLHPALPTIALPPLLIGATGDQRWTIPVPNVAALLGFRGSWQAIATTSVSTLLLSNPVAYVH